MKVLLYQSAVCLLNVSCLFTKSQLFVYIPCNPSDRSLFQKTWINAGLFINSLSWLCFDIQSGIQMFDSLWHMVIHKKLSGIKGCVIGTSGPPSSPWHPFWGKGPSLVWSIFGLFVVFWFDAFFVEFLGFLVLMSNCWRNDDFWGFPF